MAMRERTLPSFRPYLVGLKLKKGSFRMKSINKMRSLMRMESLKPRMETKCMRVTRSMRAVSQSVRVVVYQRMEAV